VLDILLAVALSGLLDNFLLEISDHVNNSGLAGPCEGLDEDGRLLKRLWVLNGTFLGVVDLWVGMVAEAAHTEDLIGSVLAVDVTVAEVVLLDALAVGTLELAWSAGLVTEDASLFVVETVVTFEAAGGLVLV
jgi:hypothetical protein